MAKPRAGPASAAPHPKNAKAGGSLGRNLLSLQELKKQIAAQKGKLVLVAERDQRNGYLIHYQPAASRSEICKKFHGERLQRWRIQQKSADKNKCEKKLMEAAARRASIRQAMRDRLKRKMQLIEKTRDKKQEILESKQQVCESKVLEASNRRLGQQEELKQKLLKQFKKTAKCREETERREAELRTKRKTRIEAREQQAHALRKEHLQKIKKKCSAATDRTGVASTVSTEA